MVEFIEFSDGSRLRLADLLNAPPVIGAPLLDQTGRVGDLLSFGLASGAFSDPDGDSLRFAVRPASGDTLPSWLSFNPDSGLFSGIPPVGMQGEYDITVFAVDASGYAVSQTFMLQVVARNSQPIAANDVADVSEDDLVFVSGNVLTNDRDIDIGDALSVANAGTYQGTYGSLTLQANGSYSYALNNSSNAVQNLRAGQQVQDIFALQTSDGIATAASNLTITVTGSNDGPMAQGDTASVSEDGIVSETGNVLTNDNDVDAGDVLRVNNPGTFNGTYGSLALQANGSYTYNLNNASTAVQSLRSGQQVADVFTLQTTDGIATAASSLTLTITGSNDAPIVQADVAAVAEDGIVTATGNVLTNDRDTDVGDTLSISNAGTYQGTYGSLTLRANGSYSYALNNSSSAVQSLRAGQQINDVFSVTTTDSTASANANLTITVTGSNDGPVAQGDIAAVAEDGIVTATGNVLTNDSDVDAVTVLNVANAGTYTGTYGSLVLQANGSYAYNLANTSTAVQSLRVGQQVSDTFVVTTSDGIASANANLIITVTGSNDGPVVQADAASLSEDGNVTASGNVLTNDSDIDAGSVLSVANSGTYQGTYGQLVLQANGSYSYALNNSSSAVQSLRAGQQVQDVFSVATTDGTASANANLTITVTGSNDAPTLVTTLADQRVNAGQAFTLDFPDNSFADIDQGDILSYSATLANGSALPSWLSFNANGLIFTGTAASSLGGQSFDLRVTATDRSGITASDVFSLAISGTGCPGLNLIGTRNNDRLTGSACDDSIDGRQGADTTIGGDGNDLYYVDEVASHCSPGDVVTEYLNQGYDRVIATVDYVLPQHVEALTLGGSSCIDGTGNNLDNWLSGNSASNSLDGKEGNDLISAGSGDDCVYGGVGNDILEGQEGNDWLEGSDGRDALCGGAGNDTLKSNNGRGLLAGGRGNDALYAGTEATVIAFNKGDGCDTLYLNGSSPLTVSLGSGLRYEDLRIRRSGNDLFMDFNSSKSEYIKISGYYGLSSANRPAITLQMLTQASGAYNPNGSERLRDNQVETFDATKLIRAFDTAYATTSSLRSGNAWAVMNNLLDAHLTGSNTAALGGDLAYQFGSQSSANLAGMSMTSAGAVLSDASFASGLQTLNRPAAITAGPRLMG